MISAISFGRPSSLNKGGQGNIMTSATVLHIMVRGGLAHLVREDEDWDAGGLALGGALMAGCVLGGDRVRLGTGSRGHDTMGAGGFRTFSRSVTGNKALDHEEDA